MKLVASRVNGVYVAAAVLRATESGWLIHQGEELRCGFGEPIASITTNGLASLQGSLNIFDGLQCDRADLVSAFASIPFDRNDDFDLVVPRFQLIQDANGQAWLLSPEGENWEPELSENRPSVIPKQIGFRYSQSPDDYAGAVAEAVDRLRNQELQKVVLARSCQGELAAEVSTSAIATRLHQLEPTCTIYAMPTSDGRRFTGASPELLVALSGRTVRCHPLAGTISIEGLADTSAYTKWLHGSAKNRVEHQIVVLDIIEQLRSYCTDISADDEPSIVPLRSVAHLGTNIAGEAIEGVTALDLVAALHPTPAVGGLPREAAEELIHKLEPNRRGAYAGAVGWLNAQGEGSWWVAIRGILTRGREFEVWAGAGIVADSDPIAEREETKYKMDSVLHAIGLGTLN